jgi:hypothetical protein
MALLAHYPTRDFAGGFLFLDILAHTLYGGGVDLFFLEVVLRKARKRSRYQKQGETNISYCFHC